MTTKIICITNQKGSVGKTTTAVSLAHGLSLRGKHVLLIDLDPQGQFATALGRNPEPGVFYLLTMGVTPQETTFLKSWVRFSGRDGLCLFPGDQHTMAAQTMLTAQDQSISAIRNSVNHFFKDGLHYIIFDTAPSVGGVQERAVWAPDFVIVPTATESLSADSVSKVLLIMSILQEKKNWSSNLMGILPTYHDEQTRESKATMNALQECFKNSLLPPIHRATILRECAAEGQTIFEVDPFCRAAKEYQILTQLVMKF